MKPPSQPARTHRAADLALVLLVAALMGVLFDSEGLGEWAGRMDVGPAQTFWLALLAPVHRAMESAGLTRPRRALMRAADAADTALRARGVVGSRAKEEDDVARALDAPPDNITDSEAAGAPGGSPRRAPGAEATPAARGPVLLVGDSMMSSALAPAILRSADPSMGARVINASRPATGLSRRGVYDWPGAIARLRAEVHPSAFVFAIGGNDAVIVKDEGHVHHFGTPEWDAMYARRVRGLMVEMTGEGARVLWLGLAIVESRTINEAELRLNRIFRDEAAGVPGVTFMETTPFLSTPAGQFATFLPDERGHPRRIRAEDGQHLTDAGAERVARPILDWVKGPPP